jgi:RNA 3'-terminal phosphate cyclase (ATP)
LHTLDGSHGEGGGSILRLATALALITQEPIKIINIRQNRKNPGLQTQHLMGIHALSEFCGGELKGDFLGSKTITFYPSNSWKDHLKIEVATAGSIALIIQIMQIAILATKNHKIIFDIIGGATFGKWAPTIPYIEHVTWNIFRNMNCVFDMTVNRHGFYPRGGARVRVSLKSPSILKGLKIIDFSKPKEATIFSCATHHLKSAQVAERQSKMIRAKLQDLLIRTIVYNEYLEASNPGSGVLVFSKFNNAVIGGDSIGERGLKAEKVGEKAFDRYINTINSNSTVDPFLADQILPVMAIASNSSVFLTPYLTNHTKTNIEILHDFLDISISTEKIENQFKVSIDV